MCKVCAYSLFTSPPDSFICCPSYTLNTQFTSRMNAIKHWVSHSYKLPNQLIHTIWVLKSKRLFSLLRFSQMGENFKSEDILGFKLDRCISDTLIKTGSIWRFLKRLLGAGLFGGIIFSVVLAKSKFLYYITCLGRPWPLIFGTGFGLGMGISNCNNDFKQPLPLVSHRIVVSFSDLHCGSFQSSNQVPDEKIDT